MFIFKNDRVAGANEGRRQTMGQRRALGLHVAANHALQTARRRNDCELLGQARRNFTSEKRPPARSLRVNLR